MSAYEKATYEYIKLRKDCGRHTLFQAGPAQMLDSINPIKEDQKLYILRNPVNRSVQAINPLSEHTANAPKQETRDQGINHEEGGWPREVQPFNEEHTQRHRRRVLHDESYVETIFKLIPPMMHYVAQNNAIEMYQTYFQDMQPQKPVANYSIQKTNVFRDEHKRPVTCVKFTEENNSKIAVSYCYKTSMPDPQLNVTNTCCIWDMNQQTEPLVQIQPEHPCWQLACSPVTPELLICGLESGTVSVFDTRVGQNAVSSTFVHNSHLEAITSLRYIYSRTQTDFFSGSTDGQCLWWDLRDLSEPLDQLAMSVRISGTDKPNLSNAEGVSYIEYDYGMPTRFLCGTESGLVINVNRMGKKYSEKLVSYVKAHNGPVRAVQRSTCTFRVFLTCGDYTLRIWSEEVRTAPIIVFNPYKNSITDACWAPHRYSCFMSICAGGYFYFWDLLRKYKEPIQSLNVSKHVLTRMTPHKDGELVSVGDSKGSVHLVQLSENMAVPDDHDKVLMQQLFERETRREHILDNRLKEIRLKSKSVEEPDELDEMRYSVSNEEEQDLATEKEYFRIVQEEMKTLGISSEQNESRE